MKKFILVAILAFVTSGVIAGQVFGENCKVLPGFQSLFLKKVTCIQPAQLNCKTVSIVNGMMPVDSVHIQFFSFITYDNLMGQLLTLMDTAGESQLSQTQVNYFFVNNKRDESLVIKVYKRIDLGDGLWYMDAKPVSSISFITNGLIFEPL